MIDFSDFHAWLDLLIALLVLVGVIVILTHVLRRKFVVIFYASCVVVFVLAYIFLLPILMWISIIVFFCASILFLFINMSDIRPLLANPLKGKLQLNSGRRMKVEKIFDREATYKIIFDTVQYLSKNKIGAIMTFERKVPLTDVVKSGTSINAPVSMELLITIFYPGTRLHDGAVIIHGNQIVAASVYYSPTTKPLAGKFGSRHRAAIGISEITDSVTVVVSEETGRISIAFEGELESVTVDSFVRVFEAYMDENEENELED